MEKIEDEYDIALAEAAYKEYLKNPQTISFEEIMKENNITEKDLKNYENIELE